MSSPTQEQIEAALNWLQWLNDDRLGKFEKEPFGVRQILRPCKRSDHETLETTSSRILAAAYREKCQQSDFAYSSIEEFEEIVGYKVNQAFKDTWRMARLTKAQLGI